MPVSTRGKARRAASDLAGGGSSAAVETNEAATKAKPTSKRSKASRTASTSPAATTKKPRVTPPPVFAFLRGVNVGGRVHSMASIASALTAAGFLDVSTFLASGNVILSPESPSESREETEVRVEGVLEALFGCHIPVVVRSVEDLERISSAVTKEATATNVVLLKDALSPAQRQALAELATADDELEGLEREFVWYSRAKMSESPLFKVSFEKRLSVPVTTTRTINTLRRLLQRAARR